MRNLMPATGVALAFAAILLMPRSAQAWSFCPFGILDFDFGGSGNGYGYPGYPHGGPGYWFRPEAAGYGPPVILPPYGPGPGGYPMPGTPWGPPLPAR